MELPAPEETRPSDSPKASDSRAVTSTSREGAPGGRSKSGDDKLLTTGEMARLSNSTLRTVRFYEEEGILRPVKRTDGGHRLFDRGELDRLLFVSDLRTAGLSLDEIKEILALKKGAANGKDAAKDVRRILGVRIQELHEKLAVLTRLRDEFAQTSEIIASCLTCQDNEGFPEGCRECSVITSHAHLPRSTRVLWAVGPSHARASAHEKIEKPANDPETAASPATE